MRKLLTGLIAASMLIPGIASADPDRRGYGGERHDNGWHGDNRGDRGDRGGWHDADRRHDGWHGDYRRGPPPGWRQYRRGERFDVSRSWNYTVINYNSYRGLRPPPYGYHWVRNGNDAVLVGITSGIVAGIVAGAIMR